MRQELPPITLPTLADTYNFYVGMPVALTWKNGQLVPMTKWARRWQRVKNILLRPFRRRLVVTAIDRDAGVITITDQSRFWERL